MSITREQVIHMAELAGLAPDEATLELFARQFSGILEYMDLLNAVDTQGVEALYRPVQHERGTRPDGARPSRERKELLAGAPEQDGQYFVVPRIVG
jgi:aspartyl-tRNA(Asn)/glutamyl-tRNA(Gln) amidotransferase subunit C